MDSIKYKKAAVYTRTGDDGFTGLVGGTRIKKSDSRIRLYGEVDELNSHLGLAISSLPERFDKEFLYSLQSSLFDLGSNLACENEKRELFHLPQVEKNVVEEIEKQIDFMDSNLSPLKTFILPGGSYVSSAFHVCRTVSRRVERQMVEFEEFHVGEIPKNALVFVNRLSDYFFTLSRFLNNSMNIEEIPWIAKKK